MVIYCLSTNSSHRPDPSRMVRFVCAKSGTDKEVCEYYGQHVSWPALGYSACA